MDYPTVLLVCPATNLQYARSERSNWQCAIRMTVVEVPSPVTIESVTRTIQAIQPDGIAYIGHCGPDGMPLDNGELLTYDTLVPVLQGRVSWLYLGACDSYPLAERLAVQLCVPILCTIGPVYDRGAYGMGTGLAYALDGGEDFLTWAGAMTEPGKSRGWKLVTPPATAQEGSTFRHYRFAAPSYARQL